LDRNSFPYGLFSIKWGTVRKTVVYSRSLIKDLNTSNEAIIDKEPGQKALLESGFALPKIPYPDIYRLDKELEKLLSSKAKSQDLINQAIGRLEKELPTLVSFTPSPIDQQPWERMAGTFLQEDGQTIETGLLYVYQNYRNPMN
jgi:hypothetical protein